VPLPQFLNILGLTRVRIGHFSTKRTGAFVPEITMALSCAFSHALNFFVGVSH
jgi:hypothetical protein